MALSDEAYYVLKTVITLEKVIVSRYELIFSNKSKYRVARHFIFWAVICVLKFYSDLYPNDLNDLLNPDAYKQSLSSLICFIPLYVFSAYSFNYILLPQYLQKKKYAAFISAVSIVALCNFTAGIFLSMLYFRIQDWNFTGSDKTLAPIRTSIYQGVILAFFSTGGIVTAIYRVSINTGLVMARIIGTRIGEMKLHNASDN